MIRPSTTIPPGGPLAIHVRTSDVTAAVMSAGDSSHTVADASIDQSVSSCKLLRQNTVAAKYCCGKILLLQHLVAHDDWCRIANGDCVRGIRLGVDDLQRTPRCAIVLRHLEHDVDRSVIIASCLASFCKECDCSRLHCSR